MGPTTGRRAAAHHAGRPHVGRADELAHVVATVARADGRGAIVAGQPGVGKSHLLDVAAQTLAAKGWAPLCARGDPNRVTPFGALGALLPPIDGGDAMHSSAVLRNGLNHLLQRAAPDRPLLVVDDLHAFDPASATLLQQAALDGRFRVIGTLRTGSGVPDAVTALWKDDLVERLDLGPLNREEADELVERLLGGPVNAETRARLWRWVEGNPLLITEIVTQAQARGSWRRSAGLWHLDHGDSRQPLASPTLAAILDERLADAPAGVADVVDVLAMAGHLPVEVVRRLVDPSALAAAERARLTRNELRGDQPALLLDHPMYGELRRAAIRENRATDLRNRVLDIYEELDEISPTDAALLATWYAASDRSGPRTAEMLTLAAELAWVGNDPRAAVGLARRARQIRRDDRADLVLINGLARLGQVDELGQVADEVTHTGGSDRVKADAVLNHSLMLFQFANEPDQAERLLVEARPHVTDRRWRAALTHQLATFRLQRGDLDTAESLIEPLLDSPDRATAANALAVMSPVKLLKGHVDQALELSERGVSLAMGLRYQTDGVDPLAVGEHLVRLVDVWIEAGRLVEAEQLAQGSVAELDRDMDPFSRSFIAFEVGRIARLRGRIETATRWFREAAAGFDAVHRDGFAAWSLAGLCHVRAQVGDVDGAREAALQTHARHGSHPIGLAAGEVDRCLAWVAIVDGDVESGVEQIQAAAERSLSDHDVTHASHALHDLVRLGQAERVHKQLSELAEHHDGRLLACFAAHATAAVRADADALTAAARDLEAAGCDLYAAEAWCHAAAVAHDRGAARQAMAARREAMQLLERCEGARTPLLARCPEPVELSGREAEIARLAVEGLSRREIAERLVVSPRTVDSHLQRIYRKLGVHDLAGLRELRAGYS